MRHLTFWNLRRGFANNSSSSHSMVLLDRPAPHALTDSPNDHAEYGYGRDAFTLASAASKKGYLAALLFGALQNDFGAPIARQVLSDLNLADMDEPVTSVDHQSQIRLPMNEDQSGVNMRFAQEFIDWVMRDNVAILGGDDEGIDHPARDKGLLLEWRHILDEASLVAWKDDTTNAWSLFSRTNGLTMRLSFDDRPSPEDLRLSEQPATRPNLVDVKITDNCPFKCAYCYQGSLPNAPHAPLERVVEVAHELARARVFEVALGGGEPTMHPDFDLIIQTFRGLGVVPNMTTRNLAWLQSKRALPTLSLLGGIAVSVDTVDGAQKALAAISAMNGNLGDSVQAPTVSIQVVVGAMTEQEFRGILRAVYEHKNTHSDGVELTLLGYKTNGFGAEFLAKNPALAERLDAANAHWPQWVVEEHASQEQGKRPAAPWVSIDTALAQASETQLTDRKISKKMFHRTEGTQSMYVDAVRGVMAPSSFAASAADQPWEPNTWLETYRTFAPAPQPSKRHRVRR